MHLKSDIYDDTFDDNLEEDTAFCLLYLLHAQRKHEWLLISPKCYVYNFQLLT